jgi:hypothetical protein
MNVVFRSVRLIDADVECCIAVARKNPLADRGRAIHSERTCLPLTRPAGVTARRRGLFLRNAGKQSV